MRNLSPGADDWLHVCKQPWYGAMLAVRRLPMSGNLLLRQTLELARGYVLQ